MAKCWHIDSSCCRKSSALAACRRSPCRVHWAGQTPARIHSSCPSCFPRNTCWTGPDEWAALWECATEHSCWWARARSDLAKSHCRHSPPLLENFQFPRSTTLLPCCCHSSSDTRQKSRASRPAACLGKVKLLMWSKAVMSSFFVRHSFAYNWTRKMLPCSSKANFFRKMLYKLWQIKRLFFVSLMKIMHFTTAKRTIIIIYF